jgi:cellulose 1,4-beta-cellobiosidase
MKLLCFAILVCLTIAQNAGTQKQEYHIPFPYSECTKSAGCKTSQGSITLDENWRWMHNVNGYDNCFTGTEWNRNYCPDPQSCTRNCAIDGVPPEDWRNPYGI